MLDLTIVIITKNEEQNLKKCIESFKGVAKRIVVVDSYSTDGTKDLCNDLAKYNNLSFYEHKFTPELVEELKKRLPKVSSDVNGIILKRRVYFMGRWIKHGGKYPELLLRIFRTGSGECEQKLMDEHLIIKSGNSITFDKDIIDNNNKGLEWWTNKHNWYSNKEVEDYRRKQVEVINHEGASGKQAKRKRFIKENGYYKLPLFLRAHIYFIYRYYIRLGFLDGKEGIIYHFLQAYWYRFLVDAKIYECDKFDIKIENQVDLK